MREEIKKRIETIRCGEIPEGYSRTRAGVMPLDWQDKVSAKDVFQNHTNKKHNGELEVLSATQDRGIIPRSEVDIDIKYAEENIGSYKKVENGDFVISLRSFQGGIEYSEYEGLVSPAYTVLKAKKPISDYFYRAYFKTNDFIKRLNGAVYGIRDGKQIGYEDFGELAIHYPPLSEQQKIAEILSTCDRVIELKQQLLEEKKKRKQWLMKKLISGEKRISGFSNVWEKVKISDISSYKASSLSANILNSHDGENIYPVYDAAGIFSYVNFYENEEDYVSIVKDGAGAGRTTLCRKKSSTIGTMGSIFPNEKVCVEYLYYVTCLIDFEKYINGSTIPHVYYKDYSKEIIELPPLEEQARISKILSTFEQEIKLLQEEVESLYNKKKALMQLLLTGIVRV